MSQCSSNSCELLRDTKPHIHISWVCQSKPGGTGFLKPVGTVLCQQSQRLAVWISVAPVLETGGTGFTGSVTASFWEVGYLYPTTPSVACCCFWGCWCASLLFLAKPKPFLLSPTPLCEVAWSCEIFELGSRERSQSEQFESTQTPWALLDIIKPCEVFVTLGGVPPRRLGVARELPRCGELRDSLWRSCFTSEREEEKLVEVGKWSGETRLGGTSLKRLVS